MKIGIVSVWRESGIGYVALAMHEALRREHDVYVLTRPDKLGPLGTEWRVDNLTEGSPASFGFPLRWAEQRGLDLLIFNERHDCDRLRPLREAGFKTLCLQEWEFVSPEAESVEAMNACFDGILAPTECAYRRFREIGLERVYHIPWGVDLALFQPWKKQANAPLHFFQPVGFGGVAGRKNADVTRRAFAKADTGDATLLMTLQRPGEDETGKFATRRGTLTRGEMAALYGQADVALLPSRWEGLGLTFIEALASGLAVVAADAPPMSDYVRHEWNGLRCPVQMRPPPRTIQVEQAMIDADDYVAAIEALCRDPEGARRMGRNSRKLAQARYNWRKNGERLARVVEEVAGG